MTKDIKILNRTLLDVLGDQPHIGFAVFSRRGIIVQCNLASRQMYYGTDRFDPIGRTVRELEGDEFAAELLSVIEQICLSCEPLAMDHIRFGRRLTSVGWPIRTSSEVAPTESDAVLAMSMFAGPEAVDDCNVQMVESRLASWGAMESLTARELEVLAEIGRGRSQKDIADVLGITRKTVETHRARIGQKLHARSSNELARIAYQSGFTRQHVHLKRQECQEWMKSAQEFLPPEPTTNSTGLS